MTRKNDRLSTKEEIERRYPNAMIIRLSNESLVHLISLYSSQPTQPTQQNNASNPTIETILAWLSHREYIDNRTQDQKQYVFHNIVLDHMEQHKLQKEEFITECEPTTYHGLAVRAREIMYPLNHRASMRYRTSISTATLIAHFLEAIGQDLIILNPNPVFDPLKPTLDTKITHGIPSKQIYFISDKAYSYLVGLGRKYKYCRSENAFGLSEFLETLSRQKFVDTRPQFILDQQTDFPLPIWSLSDPTNMARPRTMSLSLEAIANYVELSQHFDIQRTYIQTVTYYDGKLGDINSKEVQQYKRKLTPIALTAAVLEAIGLKFLTPTTMKILTRSFKRPPRPKEWELHF